MKRVNSLLVIILSAVMAACGGRNKQSTDTSNTVDVTVNYPEKELTVQDSMDVEYIRLETNNDFLNQGIVQDNRQAGSVDFITVDVRRSYSSRKELLLQDFMDVEYIALETNDDFLNQGVVLDIGKEIILVRNRIYDGDIFVYDRTGQALRKINHQGQGPKEYLRAYRAIMDEDKGEIFVCDAFKVLVYDLYGEFKRSFPQKEDTGGGYLFIFNYDRDNLICYDHFNEVIAFVLISKQDGHITKEIKIPFKEKKRLRQVSGNDPWDIVGPSGSDNSLIPYNGNWILSEFSSDTVYAFLQDYSLPPIIARTPSIQSMDPEVMLVLRLLSDRYYFMEAIRNEYNWNTRSGFPRTFMMYDKQENAFLGYIVYNGDYSTQKEIYMNAGRPVNHEIASWQPLEAHHLVESYRKGELKDGKLKEIAATLDEEDNPVIMLIKHRK